jgi:hypothetical protein
MVDNIPVTPGTGTMIAADDIGGGILAQRVKPVWGPDGTGNDVDVASGKSLPVQLRSATGLIPIGEPTDAANTATDTTSVTGISIWKQISASIQTLAGTVGSSKVATKAAAADFADGAIATVGLKADAKSTATDTTSITAMSVWKQISASVQAIATSIASTLTVSFAAATSGGLSVSSAILASGTNATSVKASAGQIYKIECFNNSANIAYLKIYNTAGTPTAGSGTPFARCLIPGNASGAGFVTSYEVGDALGTGIGYTVTGGIADNDTTSVAASAFIVNIHYK